MLCDYCGQPLAVDRCFHCEVAQLSRELEITTALAEAAQEYIEHPESRNAKGAYLKSLVDYEGQKAA